MDNLHHPTDRRLGPEQARGAQQVATEIHTLLKSKAVAMTEVATKVETLHRHALAMHDEMVSADRSNPEHAKLQDATTILKTLTEGKMTLAATATSKDRASLRMTAANMMSRTSMIMKAAGKIGG